MSLLEGSQGKTCAAATELAAYGADKMRDGLGIEQVRQMVVAKYLEDHVKYSFELEGNPKKGAANPKIVIVEFADFECPHCALMRTIFGRNSRTLLTTSKHRSMSAGGQCGVRLSGSSFSMPMLRPLTRPACHATRDSGTHCVSLCSHEPGQWFTKCALA